MVGFSHRWHHGARTLPRRCRCAGDERLEVPAPESPLIQTAGAAFGLATTGLLRAQAVAAMSPTPATATAATANRAVLFIEVPFSASLMKWDGASVSHPELFRGTLSISLARRGVSIPASRPYTSRYLPEPQEVERAECAVAQTHIEKPLEHSRTALRRAHDRVQHELRVDQRVQPAGLPVLAAEAAVQRRVYAVPGSSAVTAASPARAPDTIAL